jgi:hypothetical protein
MISRGTPTIISTARAARALTTLMTICPLTKRDLEDAIAEAAVRHGHAVQFDLSEAYDQKPDAARQSG